MAHGRPSNLFISDKFLDACSSVCPPLRKKIPGSAGGTVLLRVLTVLAAISVGVTVWKEAWFFPGVTMFGFKRHPSMTTWWSRRALKRAALALVVATSQSSKECSPSMRTSGSTIGTIPEAWQIEAYLARVVAQRLMASSDGSPLPILRTHLHLANLHPLA